MQYSMFHSYFISQIFGLYFTIMAIMALTRLDCLREMVLKLNAKDPLLFLSATSGLLLGIFLVDLHNYWAWQPHVVVTLVCWFVLIKAALWLAIPDQMLLFAQKTFASSRIYYVILCTAIIGVLLLARGTYLYATLQLPT